MLIRKAIAAVFVFTFTLHCVTTTLREQAVAAEFGSRCESVGGFWVEESLRCVPPPELIWGGRKLLQGRCRVAGVCVGDHTICEDRLRLRAELDQIPVELTVLFLQEWDEDRSFMFVPRAGDNRIAIPVLIESLLSDCLRAETPKNEPLTL